MAARNVRRLPVQDGTPVRCPHCDRRLFDTLDGSASIRLVCQRCGQLVVLAAAGAPAARLARAQ